ncbi:MAG TPA: NAD-dependent epimerase/dehydratase family protein [Pelagibacteraceae bacterium]|jgi:nucleoside-diphosphate-sugar epimerase/quercetin dioxygenase-like cupin family protein|nr:NAD-dependent epimerase/dehydratase family protein [Pelagibacteraceae bacterium]
MSKKIVIVGALGYLGTELCKLYSGESWFNKIVAVDSRFMSERVSQLKDWNIKFYQGHLLDKEFIKKILNDADIVHHLAGVTDVAYIKKESNLEQDEKIKKISIEGTNNVLNSIPQKCKIIFPSTHVIFEGLKETKRNINENEMPCPVLVYSSSKVQNEKDIKYSNKNYVILRLGSVYGYSATDTMRINIMPNLFSKIASQNGVISLFSGGKQLKSLVPLIDVVRCMKFMAENEAINKETFNLVKESVTVREVAEICKKYNPKTIIKTTDDETPNLGYTLSNKKLLATGFKFYYNLEESISVMIKQWLYKQNDYDLEYKTRGEKEFIDRRGKISNYELTEPINLIGYIESASGSMRANHYHPVQEQKVLLVKGQFISIYKSLLDKNAPKITHVINEGDSVVTKPNVAHTMVFTKDSIFLNLVKGEREHENYGITHTLPYPLVSDNERKQLLKNYKFDCRSCGSLNLKRVIALGYQPLANNLLNTKNQHDEMFPLEMNYCPRCHNCQLSVVVDPKKMFSNYLYLSSTSKSFREHFEKAAKKYVKEFKLSPKKSYIIDVGSNDGVALKPFQNLKFKKILGIEPAKNLAKIANKEKIKTYNGFLDKQSLKKIKGNADLILASNVFAHSDELKTMTECMFKLIKNSGTIIIEIQYLLNTLKDLTFDNIYHEHYNYWSLTSLVTFFNGFGGKIFKAEKIDTHGGSLRIYVKKNSKTKIEKSVKDLLKEEEKFGIKDYKIYQEFAKKVYKIRNNVRKNISDLMKSNNKIIGYGSPAKATTALNFFGISNEIDFIVEDNKLKQGKFLPGMKIPIKSRKNLKNKPDCVLVLAWNFFEEIKKKNSNLTCKFINIKDLEKD